MSVHPIKITDQGQITIPKDVREHLGTNIVILEMNDQHEVKLFPVKDIAGSLNSFAKKDNKSFQQIRTEAWLNSTKS